MFHFHDHPFTDGAVRERLPGELRLFWDNMDVKLHDDRSRLSARLAPLGNWWFCTLDLDGAIGISGAIACFPATGCNMRSCR